MRPFRQGSGLEYERSVLGAVGGSLAEGVPVRIMEVNKYVDETPPCTGD